MDVREYSGNVNDFVLGFNKILDDNKERLIQIDEVKEIKLKKLEFAKLTRANAKDVERLTKDIENLEKEKELIAKKIEGINEKKDSFVLKQVESKRKNIELTSYNKINEERKNALDKLTFTLVKSQRRLADLREVTNVYNEISDDCSAINKEIDKLNSKINTITQNVIYERVARNQDLIDETIKYRKKIDELENLRRNKINIKDKSIEQKLEEIKNQTKYLSIKITSIENKINLYKNMSVENYKNYLINKLSVIYSTDEKIENKYNYVENLLNRRNLNGNKLVECKNKLNELLNVKNDISRLSISASVDLEDVLPLEEINKDTKVNIHHINILMFYLKGLIRNTTINLNRLKEDTFNKYFIYSNVVKNLFTIEFDYSKWQRYFGKYFSMAYFNVNLLKWLAKEYNEIDKLEIKDDDDLMLANDIKNFIFAEYNRAYYKLLNNYLLNTRQYYASKLDFKDKDTYMNYISLEIKRLEELIIKLNNYFDHFKVLKENLITEIINKKTIFDTLYTRLVRELTADMKTGKNLREVKKPEINNDPIISLEELEKKMKIEAIEQNENVNVPIAKVDAKPTLDALSIVLGAEDKKIDDKSLVENVDLKDDKVLNDIEEIEKEESKQDNYVENDPFKLLDDLLNTDEVKNTNNYDRVKDEIKQEEVEEQTNDDNFEFRFNSDIDALNNAIMSALEISNSENVDGSIIE